MDLVQRKLTRSEWNNTEKTISSDEQEILNLIKEGYNNTNYIYNNSKSLSSFLKLSNIDDSFHNYLYEQFFKEKIEKICKKYNLNNPDVNKKLKRLNSSEILKIQNLKPNLESNKDKIFEFYLILLIEKITKYFEKNKKDDFIYHYYSLYYLIKSKINNINIIIVQFSNFVLSHYEQYIDNLLVLKNCCKILEGNEYLNYFKDYTLYEHQKRLFSFCRNNVSRSKIISYIAPTGTGKTLSPLGLALGNKLIFVCAARHVGLALAKSAISSKIKIAFAFGCSDATEIRLHNFSANTYKKHEDLSTTTKIKCSCGRPKCDKIGQPIKYKDGSKKIDHSDGKNVQIMISDIKSYLCAMYYMLSCNDAKDIITYWDEPTITMDKEEDVNHAIIHENWSKNKIPNMILCSATLPPRDLIYPIIHDFRNKFDNVIDIEIISHDCNKSIPIINKEGYSEMPHYLCKTYNELLRCIQNCNQYKTLYRYFDLQEIIDFIFYIDKNKEFILQDRYYLNNYFENLDAINMNKIKEYYLVLMENLDPDCWEQVYNHINSNRNVKFESSVLLTTNDSHSLTDGPTIYLADDVKKVSMFLLQQSKIPQSIISNLISNIEYNNKIKGLIDQKEKTLEDKLGNEIEKEKKMSNEERQTPEQKKLKKEIDELSNEVKVIDLSKVYVPNSNEHLKKWANKEYRTNEMTSEISSHQVERIMLLDMDDSWKVLLLMGIGVITNHGNVEYNEIMKELADNQKLYLILATSDYIYGTNYQFCHGFIGKDLENITQEKTIQAMGRIGRNQINKNYSIRLRENSFLKKIFFPQDYSLEAQNMVRLFST